MIENDLFVYKVNQKNDQAWQELYQKFYPALCNYCMKIVKDPDIAEDIVQECYIRLWDSSVRFPDIQRLTGYLYRSVYTRSLNLIRDKGTSELFYQRWGDERLSEENNDSAIELAVEEDVVKKIYRVVNELPQQQRQILLMSLEGKTVKEIAEILNISENTVKTQKKRAYLDIREKLGDHLFLFGFFFLLNLKIFQ